MTVSYRELVAEYRALRAEITRLQRAWVKLERDEMPSLLAAMREMQAAQEQQARQLETHLGFAEREEARQRSRNSPIHRAMARAWFNVFPPDAPGEDTSLGSGVTGAQPTDGSTDADRSPPPVSYGHSADLLVNPLSGRSLNDLMLRIEQEAHEEGEEAVAELAALHAHYKLAAIDRIPASNEGITEAVDYATEARDSHIQWAWHLENYSHSGAEVEVAGGLEEHREWIRRYDVILHALKPVVPQ